MGEEDSEGEDIRDVFGEEGVVRIDDVFVGDDLNEDGSDWDPRTIGPVLNERGVEGRF